MSTTTSRLSSFLTWLQLCRLMNFKRCAIIGKSGQGLQKITRPISRSATIDELRPSDNEWSWWIISISRCCGHFVDAAAGKPCLCGFPGHRFTAALENNNNTDKSDVIWSQRSSVTLLLLLLHSFNSLFSRTTRLNQHQKIRTILVKPIWIYWSKR